MKKSVVTVLIFFTALTFAQAQNAGRFAVGLRFGAQIGIHKADSDFTDYLKYNNQSFGYHLKEKSLPNPNLVLFGSYGFTNYIAVQTEFNFNFAQGVRGDNGSSWIDMTYSSLDIPLLLKINFMLGSSRIGVLGGPYLTVALGKVKTAYTGFSASDEENNIDTPNFGFLAGLFYVRPIGFGNFVADARYAMDLGTSKARISGADFGIMQRRGILISAGVEFNI